MNKQVLVFLHIPKTAGSSLSHVIHRQFNQESIFFIRDLIPKQSFEKWNALTSEGKNKYLCISGHVPFGLHEYNNRNVVYTSMLRDPLERIISFYYYILRDKKHYLHKTILSKNMSLLEFVDSELTSELCNDQTRYISGVSKWSGKTDGIKVDESIFRMAIDNIEEFFPVVGLTEMFDESLLLMKDVFSWNYVYYSRKKVAVSRPKIINIESQIVEIVKARNQFDFLLYDYAKQRLQKQILERGLRFDFRVGWFRKVNSVYSAIHSVKHFSPISILWTTAKNILVQKMDD